MTLILVEAPTLKAAAHQSFCFQGAELLRADFLLRSHQLRAGRFCDSGTPQTAFMGSLREGVQGGGVPKARWESLGRLGEHEG